MNGLSNRRADEPLETVPSEASAGTKANKGGSTIAPQSASERIGAGSTVPGKGSTDGVNTDTIEAKDEVEGEEGCIVLEQPLLTIKEVFVYRVPPLRASSGHRAEEWGLANPVFTGILKAAQVGDTCCLRLFKLPPEGELGASPELFAECVVHLDKGRTVQVYVESVIDSSRYFVLRCEDKASGRHAYVGIGFRERSSAFDLKAVLDDFVRFIDRQNRAAEASVAEQQQQQGEEEDTGPVKQIKDLSIAEGQKVHLELKVGSNTSSRTHRRPRSDASKSGGGGLLLPPPPLAGSTYKTGATSRQLALTPTSPSGVASLSQSPDEDRGGKGHEGGLNPAGLGIRREEGGGVVAVGETGEYAGDEGCRDGEEDDNWGEFESA